MPAPLTPTQAHAPAPALTPALARALLAILLAPLLRRLEARIEAVFATLEEMMRQWREGTLPPAPPERPRTPRTPTPRHATPRAPGSSEQDSIAESWIAHLIGIAASDAPRPAPRRRTGHQTHASPRQAPRARTRLAPLPSHLGALCVESSPHPGTPPCPIRPPAPLALNPSPIRKKPESHAALTHA